MGSNPTSSEFIVNIIMFFYVKVFSKDNNDLKSFFRFLNQLANSPIILKHFSKQKKRKFVTILKSPHVNKTAQEQFEFRFYHKEFLVDSFKPLTFFLLLKRLKNLSFPGLKIKVTGLLNSNKKNKSFLRAVNPDNIVLNHKFSKVTSISQRSYIPLFDCYGELYLKNLSQKVNSDASLAQLDRATAF